MCLGILALVAVCAVMAMPSMADTTLDSENFNVCVHTWTCPKCNYTDQLVWPLASGLGPCIDTDMNCPMCGAKMNYKMEFKSEPELSLLVANDDSNDPIVGSWGGFKKCVDMNHL